MTTWADALLGHDKDYTPMKDVKNTHAHANQRCT